MTTIAVNFFVYTVADGLSKTVIQEAAVLGGVANQVEWIQRELRLMQAVLERRPLVEDVAKWEDDLNDIARDAKDAIESFVNKSVKKRRTGIFYLIDRYTVGKELQEISERIRDISQSRMDNEQPNIDVVVESSEATSASPTTMPKAIVARAVQKLSSILNQQLATDRKVKKIVQEIRHEAVVMQKFVSNLEPTNETANVWLEEVKDVCTFLVNAVEDCVTRRESWFARCRCDSDRKLKEMKYARAQIGDALVRKLTYGVGEEDVGDRIGSRSRSVAPFLPLRNLIIPKIPFLIFYFIIFPFFYLGWGSAPYIIVLADYVTLSVIAQPKSIVPLTKAKPKEKSPSFWVEPEIFLKPAFKFLKRGFKSILRSVLINFVLFILSQVVPLWTALIFFQLGSIPLWIMSMLKCADKNFESIRRDLALMRAFFRDTKYAKGLKKRQSVWVDQIGVVARHAEALVAAYELSMDQYRNAGVFSRLFLFVVPLLKFAEASHSMLYKIHCISERKTIYGVANIEGRTDLAFSSQSTQGSGSEIEIHTIVEYNDNSGNLEEPLLPAGSLKDMSHSRECWLVKELKEDVESIRGEKDLMDALFEEVEDMGELDRGSEVWVEQMRCISLETASVIDDYAREFEHKPMHVQILSPIRVNILSNINKINKKIQDASRRKKTYGLLEFQTGTGSFSRDTINAKLPLYLRRCLFYFTRFSAGFEISRRRLVALWVAEGLVHQVEDEEPLEHVAERYLTELIDLNMVEIAKKERNGKVKTCRLPNALRDLLLTSPDEPRFRPGHTNPGTASYSAPSNSIIRHVEDHLKLDDICYSHIHSDTRSASASLRTCYEDVLSFLSFDTREGREPGEDIGNFLSRCIASSCFLLLRVLDLERVYKPQLPKNIDRLSRLRYLGLRWTYLDSLPSSVSSLLKLQTLDLKHTYINTLISSIWKMQLRHLFLSETYRTKFPPQPKRKFLLQAKHNSLSDLQTLWGLFIDEESPVKGGLDKLVNIKKLGLACQSMSLEEEAMTSQLEAVADWLLKLKHLQSIRLKSRDGKGQPWNLHLKSLENHTDLTDMYLLGILSSSSILSQFPPSLVKLTLSHSRLQEDPMKILGNLPKLQSLSLLADSYMRETLLCISGSFTQLEVLKFWKLEQLKQLKIEQEALPALTELEFRLCKSLEMRPDGLQHVRTLRKLKLTNMPKQFIRRVEKSTGHKLEIVVDDSS